ncbi:hypothetical protein PG993_005707 [Apiospora rasikravindrae]|uniref:Secreted protein n=1 Tax=Apiospora rasikravindrae TaxID=990691 RepID=A0ABR1T9J7_9PEZI
MHHLHPLHQRRLLLLQGTQQGLLSFHHGLDHVHTGRYIRHLDSRRRKHLRSGTTLNTGSSKAQDGELDHMDIRRIIVVDSLPSRNRRRHTHKGLWAHGVTYP